MINIFNVISENCSKTIEHIVIFLKSVRASQEVDELAIRQLCYQMFSIKILFAPKSAKKFDTITFQDFKKWLYTQSPNNGDVVTYENCSSTQKMISIVHFVGLHNIISGATLYENGDIITSDTKLPLDKHRSSTNEETQLIHQALSSKGLEWSYEYSKPVEKYTPVSGSYVRVTFSDGSVGAGVFGWRDGDDAIMMCIKKGDEPIQYGFGINIGNIHQVVFKTLDAIEKKTLLAQLNDAGKDWNPHVRRIEELNLRVKKGRPYYCINDRMYVVKVHESLSTLDNRRYANGNYFKTKEDGMEALSRAIHAIKKFHARPNPDSTGGSIV
ncbi:hypothetical protein [Dysgonomonas sp. Marseille-P4361]|uniref:hypothetical protein n=1 Tax=Dysgonomonas sp. Marseille-P4361 TaxID=2161820 RepID=UPI0013597906|nr:hypothetical protein [Dysgonomonas sp. Marseille-P4361]